jgi:hypothetical protein
VIRLNGSDTYFCNLDYRQNGKINFTKSVHCKKDGLLAVSKFTADKTNEIFL